MIRRVQANSANSEVSSRPVAGIQGYRNRAFASVKPAICPVMSAAPPCAGAGGSAEYHGLQRVICQMPVKTS
jgi:hypothetical protein